MKFGVAFSVEAPRDVSIDWIIPPKLRRKLECWSRRGRAELLIDEPGWWSARYGGVLSKQDFKDLVEEAHLEADDVQTMGILGAPWSPSGFGPAPAVAFIAVDNVNFDRAISCYVTPLPEVSRRRKLWKLAEKKRARKKDVEAAYDEEERCFERIKQVLLSMWGSS